jgi:hypothetical protein
VYLFQQKKKMDMQAFLKRLFLHKKWKVQN